MSGIRRDRCPGCQSHAVERIASEEFRAEKFEVSECKSCGLVFTSFQSRDFNEGYKADSSVFSAKYDSILKGERQHDRHVNYLEEAAIVKRHLPAGRILDVGCNAGWFLGYLKQYAEFEVTGLEPSATLAQVTRDRLNVKVHNGYLIDGVFDPGSFDFVTMTDVFEHIPEPNTVLGTIRKILSQSGKVMIKVPNVQFTRLKQRIKAKRGLGFLISSKDIWDAKEHIVHYDPETLASILRKNGFRVLETRIPKPIQTRGSGPLVSAGRFTTYVLARSGVMPGQDILVIAEKN